MEGPSLGNPTRHPSRTLMQLCTPFGRRRTIHTSVHTASLRVINGILDAKAAYEVLLDDVPHDQRK